MRGKPTENRTDLGNTIRALCANKGWTQGQLADKLNVRPATLSRWVCGADPKLSTIIRIADALGVSLDELAGRQRTHGQHWKG